MKKYITKSILGLTTSFIAFIFVFSPMISNAATYSLKKTKHVSFSTESFDVPIEAKIESSTGKWSIIRYAPLRTSGFSQYAQTIYSGLSEACDINGDYLTWLYGGVEYRNMSQTFYTNKVLYEWRYVKSSKTLK